MALSLSLPVDTSGWYFRFFFFDDCNIPVESTSCLNRNSTGYNARVRYLSLQRKRKNRKPEPVNEMKPEVDYKKNSRWSGIIIRRWSFIIWGHRRSVSGDGGGRGRCGADGGRGGGGVRRRRYVTRTGVAPRPRRCVLVSIGRFNATFWRWYHRSSCACYQFQFIFKFA